MSERITVQEAAKLLGVSELTIRCGMQDGTLPIGRILNVKGQRKNYLIYKKLVNKITGECEDRQQGG